MGEQAGAYFVLGVMALIIVGAGLKLYVDYVLPRQLARSSVKRSTLAPAPYVAQRAPNLTPRSIASVASRQEAEVEARREVRPEGSDGIITITENALQARLDATYERAAVETFAALFKAGYLESAVKARQLSAAKQLIFQVSGGRQLQALNAAIDAVPVPVEEPAPVSAAKPISGSPRPAGVAYAGEFPD